MNRIKQLRKILKLTQGEFAERIGAKQSAVSAWEIDYRKPPEKQLYLIAYTFGVRLEWLKTGNGDIFETPAEKSDKERRETFAATVLDLLQPLTPEKLETLRALIDQIEKAQKKRGKETPALPKNIQINNGSIGGDMIQE